MGSRWRGWDVPAAVAAAIALAVIGVNVVLTGGGAAPGYLAAQSAAGLLCAYGSSRAAPARGPALAVAGVALAVLGVLAILSTGLPLLVAGVLALVAAAHTGSVTAGPAAGRRWAGPRAR